MLGVVPAKRSAHAIVDLLASVKAQLDGRAPDLVTTDEFAVYPRILRLTWPPPPKGERSPDPLTYAQVRKTRGDNGRVTKIETTLVRGTGRSLAEALNRSSASTAVNTAFVERHNATDRHRNARKARQTYRFSKDWTMHAAVTYLACYTYNFCWPVRTLRGRPPSPQAPHPPRTPAMAAGLTDHVWPLNEWLRHPTPGLSN